MAADISDFPNFCMSIYITKEQNHPWEGSNRKRLGSVTKGWPTECNE